MDDEVPVTDESLEHFGARGMRWGRLDASSQTPAQAKATAIANAHRLTHGIDNAGALLPHDKAVGKGGPEVVANTMPAAFTKDPTTAQRKLLAKMGIAMPDGSFYIRNGPVGASDLQNAIDSVGRGESGSSASGDPIRLHIIKRAKALGLSNKIPVTWNADGSLKEIEHGETIGNSDTVEHFGIKGMKWGVERSREAKDAHPGSADSMRAANTRATIQKHGIGAVSSGDLQHLVSRQNLEKQHAGLNAPKVSAGQKFLDDLVKAQVTAAEKEANKVVGEYAVKGAIWLGTAATKQLLGTKAGAGKHA